MSLFRFALLTCIHAIIVSVVAFSFQSNYWLPKKSNKLANLLQMTKDRLTDYYIQPQINNIQERITFFNTLTRNKDKFESIEKSKVTFYR